MIDKIKATAADLIRLYLVLAARIFAVSEEPDLRMLLARPPKRAVRI
jgi:hypothetical protein